MDQSVRIGIDVGGTFTDFVMVDEARGLIFTGKRLTTPGDPSVAIIEGTERLLREAGTAIGDVDSIVHGTTLVTNTVIERKGARVGLITTRGFRDSLEMGSEIRYDLYDLFLERPEPLAPRYLRLEVDERIDAGGAVLRPLDPAAVRAAGEALLREGVEAIAVCFLHSYRNDAHERLAREVLAELAPGLPVCISSEVAPEIREFERGSTTVANAYVLPLMRDYLARLETRLRAMGLDGTLYVMLSGGGITTIRAAQQFPIRIIESGPAAGAMGASFYSRLIGADHLISFDMGGTTAKMCLIDEGRPEHAHEFEAARVRRFRKGSGLPLKVPVIDLIEIGAGGGSLARVDPMGLLKVGPESAGSQPGPVCYARGGTEPAVTDADLLLGYLSPEYFLGGEMKLDLDAVRAAMETRVARPLGLDVTAAAAGIHSIVNENMAAATRMYIAEKGRDPRRYTMIAFGGAGPVHAYGLAKLLKLRRIVCPLGAGVMSALGFLVAPSAIDFVRSYVARLEGIDWDHLNRLFDEMEAEGRRLLADAGVTDVAIRRHADMRYVGQGFEIGVALPAGRLGPESVAAVRDEFLATYERLFDRRIAEVPIEALTWRLGAAGPTPDIRLHFAGAQTGEGTARKGTREVYFPETGYVACPVYSRYALAEGAELRGPAVIEERESTVVVGADARVTVDRYLNLVIDIDAPGDMVDAREEAYADHR
ncbi:MAG: hydantoinase/oxoprolinase family protein [Alphaproteobacteria bacterium]|nr:hydantoinase/oxoprolinase family protein [Alphaproteobacteria bacterium]